MSNHVDWAPERLRARVALLVFAALSDDYGEAGYCEGMAQRMADESEAIPPGYVERLDEQIDALLPEVVAVIQTEVKLCLKRGHRWGARIRLPDDSDVREAIAARLKRPDPPAKRDLPGNTHGFVTGRGWVG